MRKKTFKRMLKRVEEINENPLSTPIKVKRLLPEEDQPNYNPILREWSGPKEFETVAETTGIFSSFKESEEWKPAGMVPGHDYKISITNNVEVKEDYIIERIEDGKIFEVVNVREYIGENVIGLRPVL